MLRRASPLLRGLRLARPAFGFGTVRGFLFSQTAQFFLGRVPGRLAPCLLDSDQLIAAGLEAGDHRRESVAELLAAPLEECIDRAAARQKIRLLLLVRALRPAQLRLALSDEVGDESRFL